LEKGDRVSTYTLISNKLYQSKVKTFNLLTFQLDIWNHPKHVNDTMTVRVPPEHLTNVLANLQSIDAKVNTLIDDMQT